MAINTKTSPPIVFFGTGDFSLTALTALVEASYTIAAVVTKPDSRSGRGHKLTPPLVKVFAQRHNTPVWQPENLSEITPNIQELGRPAGVLASYGKIIPQKTIDLFHPGIINIHPSLLPKYRGPSPIESAIVNGDSKTGVSIMQLAAAMDAGPVYTAKEHALTGKETAPELYEALAQAGANLLLETLPAILDETLVPHPQDEDEATYSPRLSKSDSLLDPERLTAAEAERRIRAYLGFPKSKLSIEGRLVIITRAHVTAKKSSPLDIPFKDSNYLSIEEVVAPSGRRMSAADFARGYLTRPK